MATTVTVRDLDNYPGVSKTITVDQATLVPVGYDGDEQWVLTFRTSAFSDNTLRTPIQDIFVREVKCGWLKSSGLVELEGYATSASSKSLKVKLDDSNQYYTISIAEGESGVNTIADAIESAIQAIPTTSGIGWSESDDELAYKNAMVEFKDGKFYIMSGTFSKHYTGSTRSSVQVDEVLGDTMYYDLGFDLNIDSQTIASTGISEALVNQAYTTGDSILYVDRIMTAVSGSCGVITDGDNTDYFQILGVNGLELTVPTSGTNGFVSITNNYDADKSKVQILKYQDPDSFPVPTHRTVDAIIRWGINSMVNQIDFSS